MPFHEPYNFSTCFLARTRKILLNWIITIIYLSIPMIRYNFGRSLDYGINLWNNNKGIIFAKYVVVRVIR